MTDSTPNHPYGISYDGTPFSGRQPRWQNLIDIINTRGFRNIAEIGVHIGLTTFKVLEHCDLDAYFLVDSLFTKSCYDGVFPGPTVCMQMRSAVASTYIAPKSLDLVFIDGEHTYAEVKQDSLCWLPKIKDGGIICGHDYGHFSIEVADAVRELYTEFKLIDDDAPDVITHATWNQSAVWIVEVPAGVRIFE